MIDIIAAILIAHGLIIAVFVVAVIIGSGIDS